jgi:hypothetical protein
LSIKQDPITKITNAKITGGVVPVESLSNKHEALSSTPSTTTKKKKKKGTLMVRIGRERVKGSGVMNMTEVHNIIGCMKKLTKPSQNF